MARNVVVTGGARGVGRATAEAFLALEDTVFITDYNADLLEKTREELSSRGTIYAQAADVRKTEDVNKLASLLKEYGGCDVLANCAGVFRVGLLHNAPEDDFDFQFDVNVRGIFHTCRALIPQMLDKGKGAVVNVSSVSGIGGDYNMSLYCATKGAVNALSRAMAMDYSSKGVRVNIVSPSAVKTPMFLDGASDKVLELFRKNMPDKRLCEPEWVANAIVYLASEQAEHICGAEIPVDGGLSAWNGQPDQEK